MQRMIGTLWSSAEPVPLQYADSALSWGLAGVTRLRRTR
jgi:hypothetical protein